MALLKGINDLTLKDMIINMSSYSDIAAGLWELPVEQTIKIGRKYYPVPKDLDEFTANLCYGQRIFLCTKEENDFGLIIRLMDGYFYSVVTCEKWDADKALLFGKKILTCTAKDLYPVTMHLIDLTGKMVDNEKKLLHREPSKLELAAGIEKLNVFSDLTSLDFLRDAMKCTVPEVLLTPYNECLVRFMIAKETNDFQERYQKLSIDEMELKHKLKHKR